jgi:hypothetical protein
MLNPAAGEGVVVAVVDDPELMTTSPGKTPKMLTCSDATPSVRAMEFSIP